MQSHKIKDHSISNMLFRCLTGRDLPEPELGRPCKLGEGDCEPSICASENCVHYQAYKCGSYDEP